MKRFISILMAVMLTLSCLGVCASAETTQDNTSSVISYEMPEEGNWFYVFFQSMYRSFLNSIIEKVTIGTPSYFITGVKVKNTSETTEKNVSVSLTAKVSAGSSNAKKLKDDTITWSSSNNNVKLDADDTIYYYDGELISKCKVTLVDNPTADTETVIYAVTKDGGFCAKYTVKCRFAHHKKNGEPIEYCVSDTKRVKAQTVYTGLESVSATYSGRKLEEKTFVSATDGTTKTGYLINSDDIISMTGDKISSYFEATFSTDLDCGDENYMRPDSASSISLSLDNRDIAHKGNTATCTFESDTDAEGNIYVFNITPYYQLPTITTTFYLAHCPGHYLIEAA